MQNDTFLEINDTFLEINDTFLEINEPFLEITEARDRIKSRFFFEIFKYLKYLNRERRAFFRKARLSP